MSEKPKCPKHGDTMRSFEQRVPQFHGGVSLATERPTRQLWKCKQAGCNWYALPPQACEEPRWVFGAESEIAEVR